MGRFIFIKRCSISITNAAPVFESGVAGVRYASVGK